MAEASTDTIDTVFHQLALPIQHNKAKYLDLTNQLNNYNEIYNMNKFVDTMNRNEYEQIYPLDQNLKTTLHKLKQENFFLTFSNNNLSTWTNIIYFTICMACIALMGISFFTFSKIMSSNPFLVQNKGMIFYVALGVLSVIYLLVLMIVLSKKLMRRNNSWDEFNWLKNISE